MKEYKVWECKIVIARDSKTPLGFDSTPRMAAQNAIEKAGFEVISNFSGWGGKLDDIELDIVNRDALILKNNNGG